MTSRNQPCPCGSGKKYKRCCGANDSNKGSYSPASLDEVVQHYQAGRLTSAETRCRELLAAQPRNAQGHYLLGLIARDQGRDEEALAAIAHAFALGLDDAAARFHYAQLLSRHGHLNEAVNQFEQALQDRPDFLQARRMLAESCLESRAYPRAAHHLQILIKQTPDDAVARQRFGLALYFMGRLREAESEFLQALTLAPQWAGELHGQLSTLMEQDNRPEDAERHARQALEHEPDQAAARITLAKVERRRGELMLALEHVDAVHIGERLDHHTARALAERGEILDRLSRYDEAFQSFDAAKRGLTDLHGINFDPEPMVQILRRSERFFTQDRIDALTALVEPALIEPAADAVVRPLFVGGFLRSGTTLLERMLDCHSAIAAGGELDLLPQLEARLAGHYGEPFPECLDKVLRSGDRTFLAELRNHYLTQLAASCDSTGDVRWVVDKLPFSVAHLPLIRILFPDAMVVDLVRHPLDTVLSCYFQIFQEGNEWSFSLAHTATIFTQLREHVAHMQPLLGIPQQQLHYENLVENPEAQLRELLASIGLEWEPACLRFHEAEVAPRTASYEQVTRPLYNERVHRYRQYQAHIPPALVDSLQDITERLGYRIQTL